ncbi:lysophospholipid acyltransferase family protein [Desulfurispirillum indicum]|uniref:DUF374 domain-containing protein n=1 Tax=Desulfurispirillum indicum (strain ATCC BAA-1389 / DSM 22839 / S5) TaxID=653733 RepID=E6W1J7_DESIS|nr:lysophospholipid acyltransferase family protein [Desulfurispirillum indicum]ADU66546.1 protein of unknown function DUF374 [Desulfurispirillum indicum S5]UCZ55867.1 lysophospholipid acyltransferase family protein [Desulfurispirillum indicum]
MKSLLLFRILPFIAQMYLKICFLTCRKTYEGREILQAVEDDPKPYTIASWHGRLVAPLWLYGRGNIYALLSQHKDAEIFGRILRYFGHDAVRGSSTRGAIAALRQVIGKLRQGHDVAITPDGPKGPPLVVKPGAVGAAKATGTAVLAVSYSCRPVKILSSWDSFVFPLPFGRMHFVVEKPLYPDQYADLDEGNRLLGELLMSATRRADQAMAAGKRT